MPTWISSSSRSPRRLGDSDERMQYVEANCPRIIDVPSVPTRSGAIVLFLGFDQYGNRLEVMARRLGDELTMFHADEVRPAFRGKFKEIWGQ